MTTSNLTLIDIPKFIKTHNVGEVTNANIPSLKYKTYDPDSLWSETIFGNLSSKKRQQTFGYIKLPIQCVTPLAYSLLISCCDEFYNMNLSRVKYHFELDKTTKKGKFIEAGDETNTAKTGLSFILKHLKQVDFSLLTPRYGNSDKIKFIESNLNNILINEFLVIPAGLRDINIFTSANHITIQSDINTLYSELMHGSNYVMGSDDEMDEAYVKNIQSKLVNITTWIKSNNLSGANGIFRSNILKKRIDFSARIVLLSDPKISMDEIIVPFHILATIYSPLCYHHIIYKRNTEIIEEIQNFMKVTYIDDSIFNTFMNFVKTDASKLPENLIKLLKELLVDIMPNERVVCKRDPVLGKGSYFSAVPLVGDGHVCYIPTMILDPLGADSDGDQLMIAPIFSESAKKEAKTTLSYSEKNTWIDPKNFNSAITSLTLDAISTIFSITK